MREVARRAGVSLATVSYVVNDGPRRVSDNLRERVLGAIHDLGYQPARRGRARRYPLEVGVLVPDTTNLFFSRAISAIQSALLADGHLVVAASSHGDRDREAKLVAAFVRHQVDGLIISPAGDVPDAVERLAAAGQPVVLMDWDGENSTLNRISLDNYHSALQATRLLIESGHRRIALVGGPTSASSARARQRGYRDALAAAGIAELEEVRSGPFTHQQGRSAMLDLLSLPSPPDAIFSGSVLLTLGVLQALQERRLRWPDDLGLVGYGDARWASVVLPPLTVIEQPVDQVGEVAVRLLMASMDRRAAVQHVVLDSRLVLRDSHWRVPRPLTSGR